MNCELHIVPGTDDVANGMVVVANLLAKEQGDAEVVDLKDALRLCTSVLGKKTEVWVHGMWLPKEWLACWRALKLGKRLIRMPHGCVDPVRLKFHGWKKWLVGPFERFFLRRCAKIVATCDAEKEWIQTYLGRHCPPVEVTDIKRFFRLPQNDKTGQTYFIISKSPRPLHLLYLGRRHPLKGLEYLEEAVKGLKSVELRVVSNSFGEEKEKVWEWCDVLVLPTLSENFGLVIAEALERGKRVITTDGAPAWGDGDDYGGRLVYLKGYREGTWGQRVSLLRNSLKELLNYGVSEK